MFEGSDIQLRKTSGSPAFLAPEICTGGSNNVSLIYSWQGNYFLGKPVDVWVHTFFVGYLTQVL
jgi:hypothetical protein